MKSFIRVTFVIAFGLASLPAAEPQTHVRMVPKNPRRRPEWKTWVNILAANEPLLDSRRLVQPADGSWEKTVLDSSAKVGANYLMVDFAQLSLSGIYTTPTSDGDVLVGRWYGSGLSWPTRALWLLDTPFYTGFVLEVDPLVLDPARLVGYAESLFRWHEAVPRDSVLGALGSTFTSLGIEDLSVPAVNGQLRGPFDGRFDVSETSHGLFSISFAAVQLSDTGYVNLEISKPVDSNMYPREAYQIRERFPPLRLRLPALSREELFGELGKGTAPPSTVPYPKARDRIVMEELLGRGRMSDQEVLSVIFGKLPSDGTRHTIVQLRILAFLDALEGTGQLSLYTHAMEQVLMGPLSVFSPPSTIIGRFSYRHIDFSAEAFDLLEHGKLVPDALAYLGEHSNDPDAIRKLSAMSLPGHEDHKQRVIERIKARNGGKP